MVNNSGLSTCELYHDFYAIQPLFTKSLALSILVSAVMQFDEFKGKKNSAK
jgi:hypothetical protein